MKLPVAIVVCFLSAPALLSAQTPAAGEFPPWLRSAALVRLTPRRALY